MPTTVRVQCLTRTRTQPITSTIPVEVIEGSADPPSLQRRRSEHRRKALVEAQGGKRVGERWTRRQWLRRMLVSAKWQGFLLATAGVDMAMLIVEIHAPRVMPLVNTVTALVLGVFGLDLALRVYTFRSLLLRSVWSARRC